MAIEWHEHGESSKDGQWAIQTERLHHEPIWRYFMDMPAEVRQYCEDSFRLVEYRPRQASMSPGDARPGGAPPGDRGQPDQEAAVEAMRVSPSVVAFSVMWRWQYSHEGLGWTDGSVAYSSPAEARRDRAARIEGMKRRLVRRTVIEEVERS